jgi:hypothetical protein
MAQERKPWLVEHGKRIRAARTVAGLTLSSFALDLGVEKSTAARYEVGDLCMSTPLIAAFTERHDLGNDVRAWIVFGGTPPARVAEAYKAVCKKAREDAAEKSKRKRASGAR